RTWGWTERRADHHEQADAGPTHVGMDRVVGRSGPPRPRRPHARGDGPVELQIQAVLGEQAPRTWGWTGQSALLPSGGAAGPTHVGMDRRSSSANKEDTGRPHARGDGPVLWADAESRSQQAPRTWGWTVSEPGKNFPHAAGPTHVGMDRPCITIMPVWSRRPHARGDGPSSYSSAKGQ